ncbi:MAG: UvrB/UvrC motif-containing protein [Vallitaleaceae bacterium]|nr:UvrB/UvrC motif-containing protein [Vallitaleaceae bacterium]
MMCDKCNERAANVVITQQVGEKYIKLYLCEKCSEETEGLLKDDNDSFQQFLSGLINAKGTSLKNELLKCENCGMTLSAFRKSSKVGCTQCYKTFNNYFEPLIKRIHSNSEHTGKRPHKLESEMNAIHKIEILQNELKKAIIKEEYELAARLRDEIKLLKQGGSSC